MLNKKAFDMVKKIIPKISSTELIALQSGTTSIDRDIFKGKVNYPVHTNKDVISPNIMNQKVNDLLEKYGDEVSIYPNKNIDNIMKYIGKSKFLSYIIDEKYNGLNISVNELSKVLCRIASYNPPLGIAIMVPNSLGPAELLQHYGTEQQKNYYLPKLSDGQFIPCFGLTGPHNGSDATGSIDEGIVKINNGKLEVHTTINKRYITLAPIANLIGLAIRVNDPDGLLKKNNIGQEGVTVFLLEKGHQGLEQNTHHNPLNAGFPNGTLKGNIVIPIDNVIGGEQNIGKGWKMLMECLAAGRGICLPATAKASSNVSMVGVFQYTKHRKQFKIPLVEMEGIQDKLVNMMYHTWTINCGIDMMNTILDNGEKPAVLSAIMKQQTTDRAREVLNDAMDIYAGSAICLGKNNFLEKFYRSAPIGITVEGSNVLTRNLIIFGQGLNKSHPYIYPILESIMQNDQNKFDKGIKNIIAHSISLYMKAFKTRFSSITLENQTIEFANIANFIALQGGKLKSNQMLSSDMADIMSNLYLAHSIYYYHTNNNVSSILTNYCIKQLLYENQRIINRVIKNVPYMKYCIGFMIRKEQYHSYNDKKLIIDEMINNKQIMTNLSEDIHIKNTVIEQLYILDELKKQNNIQEYNKLYNQIIQVGEFNNI